MQAKYQMTAKDILTGLKPITQDCFEVFAPYYEERAKHYVYPRYMQSVCVLIDMGKTYYNIIRATHGYVLVVFKRTQIFGKTGVQMPICPISLTGSTQDELNVMLAVLKVGVSLRVTTEDINRYKIPRKICSDGTGPFVPVNNEYLYECEKPYKQEGAKFKKVRHLANRTIRSEGFHYGIPTEIVSKIDSLVYAWGDEYKKKHNESASQVNLWRIIKQTSNDFVNIRIISYKNSIEAVAVYERISSTHYNRILHIRNYNGYFQDTKCAMHKLTCGEIAQSGGRFLNIGLADYGGLISSKEQLVPCAHQKIYTVKTTKTSDKLKAYFK